MKNKVFLLLGICGLLQACKKETDSASTTAITVKEYKTNSPLPDVSVQLYKCSDYDLVFGCRTTKLFAVYTTNSKGECAIPNGDFNSANQGILLAKTLYWTTNGGSGERFMEPQALLQLTLHQTRVYPDTAILAFTTTGERYVYGSQSFRAPKDSVAVLTIFGNETNQIRWVVFTRPRFCLYYCPQDTLSAGSFSIAAKKFETLHSRIDY